MAKATDTKPETKPEVKPEVKPEDTKATDTKPETTATPAAAPVVPTKSKWLVAVKCPTPLERNPLIVPATNAEQAWAKFCKANGIGGTDHPKTIEPAE